MMWILPKEEGQYGEAAEAGYGGCQRGWCRSETHQPLRPQLARIEFRHREIVCNVVATTIVAGIAITTADITANHKIHVLNQVFDTNTHRLSFTC
jgi:hypothetical protein